MTKKMARAERNGTDDRTVSGRATGVVAKRAPAVLAASRGTVERARAALGGSSSGSLAVGTVFAAGLSGGMLVSRAPRLLVALAFLPTVLLGGTLLGRGARLDGSSRDARS